jgi:transposase-like protein
MAKSPAFPPFFGKKGFSEPCRKRLWAVLSAVVSKCTETESAIKVKGEVQRYLCQNCFYRFVAIFSKMLFTELKTLAAYAALSDGAAIRYSAALVGPAEVSVANETCAVIL